MNHENKLFFDRPACRAYPCQGMATVRALGTARIFTIDSRNLLRRIREDPFLDYLLVQIMSSRVLKLGDNYASFSNATFNYKISNDSINVTSKGNSENRNFEAH